MACAVCGRKACGCRTEAGRIDAAALADTRDWPGLEGQRLAERYLIVEELARGGMGVVYRAEQVMGDSTRSVVVKLLAPAVSNDEECQRRFLRECGVVSQLEHPNTVRFYDCGKSSDGQLYAAMEYVEGQSLAEAMQAGPMPAARVLAIVEQVAAALEEAHLAGVVHRDVKPENVVLTERGGSKDFVKLIDFGIAATPTANRTKLTQAGAVLGSPAYMSPEQFSSEPVGPASDVYGLALMTCEMLTGKLPFRADNIWQWAEVHLGKDPEWPEAAGDGSNEQLRQVILGALAKPPEQRPVSARQFAAACRAAVDGGEYIVPTSSQPNLTVVAMPSSRERTVRVPAQAPSTEQIPVVAPAPAPRVDRRGTSSRPLVALAALVTLALAVFAVAQERGANSPSEVPVQLRSTVPVVQAALRPMDDFAPPLAPPSVKPSGNPAVKAPPKSAPQAKKPPKAPAEPKPSTSTRRGAPEVQALPTGDRACAQASRLASRERIEASVALYRRCQSSGGSAQALRQAKAKIKAHAPGAVRHRAFNGRCASARAAVLAAESIGVGAGARQELSNSRCR